MSLSQRCVIPAHIYHCSQIRLRYAQNERTTLQIEPDTTYEQLKNMIFLATKIPVEFQEREYLDLQ